MHARFIRILIACAAIAGAPLASQPASAALIDVQFAGNFSANCPDSSSSCSNPQQSGAAYVGSAGDVWNYFNSPAGSGSLSDSTGTGSGVSVTFTADGAYTDGTATNNFYSTPYANLYGGYISTRAADGILITLSGLQAGQAFNLYTYSEQDGQGNHGRSMNVDVNGTDQTDTQSGAGTFIAGDTYLMFSGTADMLGDVNIDISNLVDEADLNGLQLQTVSVPEPSSLALLALPLGLAGIVVLRRRRSRAEGCELAA